MNERLMKYIKNNEKIVIFTGAGISTDSGIPDFRGPSGYWKKNAPIYFQDFIGSEKVRRESWERKFTSDDILASAKPNLAHLAIAQIINAKEHSHLITQNVDNLHQNSGIADEKITEIHGNATYAKCLDCHLRYELDNLKKNFSINGTVPTCDACGGIIKTATISFGQPMPEQGMREAQEKTLECDLFISIGSSLVVYPAAGFPKIAKENGSKLIIVNNESTNLDSIADLVIHEQIGDVFSNFSI